MQAATHTNLALGRRPLSVQLQPMLNLRGRDEAKENTQIQPIADFSPTHHSSITQHLCIPARNLSFILKRGLRDVSGDLGKRLEPSWKAEEAGRIHHRSHLALHRSPYHILHRRRRAGQAPGREQRHTAPLVWHSNLRFGDKQGVSQPCPSPLRRGPWCQEADPAPPCCPQVDGAVAAVQHAADTQGERDLEATFFPLARGWSWDALGQEHEAEPGPAWALPTLANGIRSQESLCDPRQVSEPIPAQPKNQD